MIKSFIYPVIDEPTRTYGGFDPVINPKADWRNLLINEKQSQNNTDSSACYIEAQQAVISGLLEYIYGIQDSNFSARFNALLSNGTPEGGDPIVGAKSIKKDGLIPEEMMSWKDIYNFNDYHSWKGVDKDRCIAKGQEFKNQYDMSYKIVFEKDTPLKIKYDSIREALKRSPVAVSVYAWLQNEKGEYYKPDGVSDTHLTTAICLFVDDSNRLYVRDTYEPFLKVIAPNTDFEFAMYWTIRKLSPEEQLKNAQRGFIIILLNYVSGLLKKIYRIGGKLVAGVLQKRN
jgi:hypothetical protein